MANVGQPVRAAHHWQRMTRPIRVAQRTGQVSHRVHDAAGDVESTLDPVRSEEGDFVGQCHVGHVDEVAPLAAVLVDEGATPCSYALRKMLATPAYGVSRGMRGP